MGCIHSCVTFLLASLAQHCTEDGVGAADDELAAHLTVQLLFILRCSGCSPAGAVAAHLTMKWLLT